MDGRAIYPEKDENGDFLEMMVDMGDSYGELITRFIEYIQDNENVEIVGYADTREEAQELTRKHYYNK